MAENQMMNILISPDKFKSSLTDEDVCNAMEKKIKRILPDSKVKKISLADGGEGLLDKQTLKGKVVKGVLDRCKKLNIPAAILCGDTTLTENEIKHLDTIIVKTIKTENITKEESIKNAYSHLIKRAEELVRLFNKK